MGILEGAFKGSVHSNDLCFYMRMLRWRCSIKGKSCYKLEKVRCKIQTHNEEFFKRMVSL